MRSKFTLLLTLLLAFVVPSSFAQQRTITGTITSADDGLPIPGVNIIIQGTQTGVQTDFNGNYSIQASAGQVLEFSFIGLMTQEITVGSSSRVDVVMETDVEELGEVVVQGYRTTTSKESTVAYATVTSETIENRPNPSLVQTLQGQLPGVNIVANTGQPGGATNILIRGASSINGNVQPLILLDGIPITADNFRSLNPNEIESTTVLKDAAGTSIYGNRGANGVIIIKSRQGSFNEKLEISYRGITGITELQDQDYDLMNSQEQLRLERSFGSGIGVGLTDDEINEFETTNWDEVFFRQGISQNHNLTLSNGSENVNQLVSLGYFDQEGILVDSDLKRFNIRSNTNGKSSNEKFTYGLNLSINYSESNEPNNIGGGAVNRNYVLGAYQSVPYVSPDDYEVGDGPNIAPVFRNTPLLLLDRLATFTRKLEELKMVGNATFSYAFTDYLSVSGNYGGDFEERQLLISEGPTGFNAAFFAEEGNDTPGSENQQLTRSFVFNANTQLNFNKSFGVNNISGLLAMEYVKAHYKTFGFMARGLDPRTYFPGDGSSYVADNSENDFFIDDANANLLNSGLLSFFAQAAWDHDGKFGLEASIRRDGSSRFSKDNRWGTFGSVSGRWNIDSMGFMEDVTWVNALKLRASHGTNGNQNIVAAVGSFQNFTGPDLFLDFFGTGTGYQGQNSLFVTQLGSPDLTWETVTQTNLGLDFSLFNSRLRGNFDAYWKTTTDLFLPRPISSINAEITQEINNGELLNQGYELLLDYDLFRSERPDGFNMTLNFVGAYNRTEIKDLPQESGEIVQLGGGIYSYREGGPIREYYAVRYAGVNPANGEALFLTADGDLTQSPLSADRVFTGKNPLPDYQGSFGFDLTYKGFFVNTQFNYAVGVDRYDFELSGFQDPSSIGSFRATRDLFRAWTPDNRVTDIPSLIAGNLPLSLGANSDRFLRSADYLRLRFASIGYDFPEEFLSKTGLNMLKIFLNGENLVTWSEWRGWDPEFGIGSPVSRSYPTAKFYSIGVEIGF